MKTTSRIAIGVIGAVVLGGSSGCINGCQEVDVPVSSQPNDSSGMHRTTLQSETSIVRATTIDPENPLLNRNFVVGYNDETGAEGQIEPDSVLGLANSIDDGNTWQRHDQLAINEQIAPIDRTRGDPALAAWNPPNGGRSSVVLYTGLGSEPRQGQPDYIVISRSIDGGRSFEPMQKFWGKNGAADGPKVAISGDSNPLGLVTWLRVAPEPPDGFLFFKAYYKPVYNITGPAPWAGVQGDELARELAPSTAGLSPSGGIISPCAYDQGQFDHDRDFHPQLAAGRTHFYVAMFVSYIGHPLTETGSCPLQQRFEIYRASQPDIFLVAPNPWRRIMSVEAPPIIARASDAMNGRDKEHDNYSARTRGSSGPPIAVGLDAGGNEFLVAVTVSNPPPLAGESTREKVIQYRLDRVDTCDAQGFRLDLQNCGGQQVVAQEADVLATANGMPTVQN